MRQRVKLKIERYSRTSETWEDVTKDFGLGNTVFDRSDMKACATSMMKVLPALFHQGISIKPYEADANDSIETFDVDLAALFK